MNAWGKCYWYETKCGRQKIGVVRVDATPAWCDQWIVVRRTVERCGGEQHRVNPRVFFTTWDAAAQQAKLDDWAKAKKLEEAVPF